MKVLVVFSDSYHKVNDPTSAFNFQLNELIKHIAANIFIFKLKYHKKVFFCLLI
ncbi:MAG: hypothetical protein ACR5K4_01740 [Sodalis sp. (in: enterobacteria)]